SCAVRLNRSKFVRNSALSFGTARMPRGCARKSRTMLLRTISVYPRSDKSSGYAVRASISFRYVCQTPYCLIESATSLAHSGAIAGLGEATWDINAYCILTIVTDLPAQEPVSPLRRRSRFLIFMVALAFGIP